MKYRDKSNMALTFVVDWMEALNAGDVDGIVDLYDSESCVLVPPDGNDVIRGSEAIASYYLALFEKYPGLEGKVHDQVNQNLGDNRRALSGHYTLRWNGGEEEERFTFVVVWDGYWVIHTHHASVDPQR